MSEQVQSDTPEIPAKIASPGSNFTFDRLLSARAGSKRGCRNVPPIEAAFLKGYLDGPEKDHRVRESKALERYEAGKRYAETWRDSQQGTTDSTQAGGSTGGFGGDSAIVSRIAASNKLLALERALSPRDRQIICYVCALEHTPSQAISMVLGEGWEKSTNLRFREALDSLVEILR